MGIADSAALQMFHMVMGQQADSELLQIRMQKQLLGMTIQVFTAAQTALLKDPRAQEILRARIMALRDVEVELDQRIAILENSKAFAQAGEPAAKSDFQQSVQKMYGNG